MARFTTAISAENSSYFSVIDCHISGFDRGVALKNCSNVNISHNNFSNSNNAIFFANCYGKASVINNNAYNVNHLTEVDDVKNYTQKNRRNRSYKKINKNKKFIDRKFNRRIKELLSIEAQERFLNLNFERAKKINLMKAKYGSLESKLIIKESFPELVE